MRVSALLCAASLLASFGMAAEPRRTGWPPKDGVRTPGILIPADRLKAEAEFSLEGAVAGVVFADKIYVSVHKPGGFRPLVAKTNQPEEFIASAGDICSGSVQAFGGVWSASCTDGKLSKYDIRAKKFSANVDVAVADLARGLAASADSLWVISDARTTISRVDPEVGRVVAEIRLPAACNSLLFADNSLWVTCPSQNRLLRVNAHTNLVEQRIELEGEPIATTFGEGSIWVLLKKEGKVVRVDVKTHKPAATLDLKTPGANGTLAFGEGSVWVGMPEFPLARIDPASDKVLQQFAGEAGGGIYVGAGSVWVADPAGRTLRRYDPKRIRATLAE